ncbi:MAG TPA: methylated-DNA--[protein]-cysteine S-methyltransferase [Polyangiales bacterium]|nr:methylated-DNA--[protein]-cysteine S-methyltransferase [Polyangiales bacterium]
MQSSLCLARVASPLGKMLVVFDEVGRLRAADFVDCEDRMRRLLRVQHGDAVARLRRGSAPPRLRSRLEQYFAGRLAALASIDVLTTGTEFQLQVWRALRRIPPGKTLTFAELAARLGKPRAVRAVGHAAGSNPVCIVIPCHRVIGCDQRLTGYAGGLDRKRWLLEHEGALARASPGTHRASA